MISCTVKWRAEARDVGKYFFHSVPRPGDLLELQHVPEGLPNLWTVEIIGHRLGNEGSDEGHVVIVYVKELDSRPLGPPPDQRPPPAVKSKR